MKLIYPLMFLLIFGCSSQYVIDSNVANKFEEIDKSSNSNRSKLTPFMNKKNIGYISMFNRDVAKDYGVQPNIPLEKKLAIIDTINWPHWPACACSFKDDTLKIEGGLFHLYGGRGFELKITEKKVNVRYVLSNPSEANYSKIGGERKKKVFTNGKLLKMVFSKELLFKDEESIIGEIIVQSEPFLEYMNDVPEQDQEIMRVIFKCKANDLVF